MSKTTPSPHPNHRIDFKIEQKPGRLLWAINRIPTWMFQLGLGRLLGNRFAMIVHKGRKTGNHNTVIVETASGDPDTGRVVFVSAYGKKAQWYLNLAKAPAISFPMKGRTWLSPRHEFLGPEETEKAVASYFEHYPGIANFLAKRGFYPWPGPIGTHDEAPIGIAFYLENTDK
jgi:deazaflavin-dependent oxidoreductase (nitroreductase family)